MNEFIFRYADHIRGALTGFDRLVFRGTLRNIAYAQGMDKCRTLNGVLLKDFGRYAEKASKRLEQASLTEATRLNRPILYLRSSQTDKEELARGIARRDGVNEGLVCVLRSIEPCASFEVYRNRDQKQLELKSRQRKCMHLYHYRFHPVFGWINARLQTWFPFSIQICLNGREWLARQMDRNRIEYLRHDNCIVWVKDWARAQSRMQEQLKANWPQLLDEIASAIHPARQEILGKWSADYYWSTYQSEWATDVVFGDADKLRALYERMVRHSLTALSCTDVMRYPGRRVRLDGTAPRNFEGEIKIDLKQRPEGVRIKHRLNANSLKAYDKAFTSQGNVLRFEATVLKVNDFRVYRPKQGDEDAKLAWLPMRKGVADLHRLAEICNAATQRYMNALAQVDESSTIEQLMAQLNRRKQWKGQSIRGLQPFGKDNPLLLAVSRGEFLLQGLRNRDLQRLLFEGAPACDTEKRRRSAWVSRQLRMLRAHGLIGKVPKTHRYQVTENGRTILAALFTAWRAKVSQLTALAA
ncbi:MAG TPA: hypothetical protein VF133_10295 [Terriglobales bacterium]